MTDTNPHALEAGQGENVAEFPIQEPRNHKISIQVGYGPSIQEFEVNSTDTVREVLGNPYIQEIIGFSSDGNKIVTVNGRDAQYGDVLRNGDQLEVVKRAGEKA
jgi:hypothetical protein